MNKILLVDTTIASLKEVTGLLRGAGYEIIKAAVDEAVAQIQMSRPDLVLIAFDSENRATQLLRQIRKDPALSSVIVAVLGSQEEYLRKQPSEEAFGADACISWPAETGEFLTRVRDLLERQKLFSRVRASEDRYRALFEGSPDAIYVHDLNGFFLDANPAALEFLGYTKHEIFSFDFSSLLTNDEDLARAHQAIEELVSTGKQMKALEYRLRKKDGTTVWAETTCHLILLDGQPAAIQGIARDITERKEAEEKINEIATRLTTTLESMTDGFITVDLNWRITYVNRRAEEMVQAGRNSLLGRNFWEAFPAAAGSTFEREYRRAIDENRTVVFEEYYAPLELWAQVTAYPSAQGLALYFRDITSDRKAREALRQSELRFSRMFHSSPAALSINTVHEGRFIEVNDRYCQLFGYTREELMNETVVGLNLWANPEECGALVRQLLERRVIHDAETQFRSKSGELRDILLSMELIELDGEKDPVLIAMITDITERKKLEEQFLRAQRMESIGRLAAGIAHDLNNLLSPIVMSVDLLKMSEFPPEHMKVINTIEQSAKRGAEVVKQVLTFSRGMGNSRQQIHLDQVRQEVQSIVKGTFPRNIRFEADFPNNLWPVEADPTRLNQVLLNLCVNARDAMPEGGTLTLSAKNIKDGRKTGGSSFQPDGPCVALTVSDSGCGIPKEVITRIFEPFFTTKDVDKGTGLGLSTVRGIVRDHGGSVDVESVPGRGSTFTIYLPAGDFRSDRSGPTCEGLPRGKGELILVVDDETSVLEITKQTLEAFGYRIVTAENGAQAIAFHNRHHSEIALVLVDLVMPVMDGLSLIANLRKNDPGIRVVVVTGHASDDSLPRPADTGEYVLTKPWDTGQMLTLLRQVLDR